LGGVFVLGAALMGAIVMLWSAWGGSQGKACKSSYISPVLCRSQAAVAQTEPAALIRDLQTYVAAQTARGAVQEVAIYYRELNNGPVFGVNQDTPFIPASLMKVPLMLTYLRHAENSPALLKATIHSPASFEGTQDAYPPREVVAPNTGYTVEDLIKRAIIFSDNRAAILLENYATANLTDARPPILETLAELGLTPVRPFHDQSDYYISVKQYASMLRLLYNAAYLSVGDSSYALGLLASAEFKDGLVAGVPAGVKVAHKFGEYSANGYVQLHDVGIVYRGSRTYILGVMTRGKDWDTNAKIIQEISRRVWNGVK